MPKDIVTPEGYPNPQPLSSYGSRRLRGSHAHKKIIEEAINFLRRQGFDDAQIYIEFHIHTGCRHGTTGIRSIDVAAIKTERKIAIECGKTSEGLLRMIRPYFDEVLHFPYPRGKSTY